MATLKPYQQNHVVSLGAHIHHINVVAPSSAVVSDVEIVQVIMPAISPVYQNNPGFGWLTIDDSDVTVDKFEFVSLQLQEYHKLGVFEFEVYEPAKVGGFDINDAKSVRAHSESLLYNLQEFAFWQIKNYGLSDYIAASATFTWPFTYYNPD
jgi:hypothetical protein